MIATAGCKINIGLHVTARRPDGYHDIETIFLPVPLCDEIEVERSGSFSFAQEGIAIGGNVEDNLCVRAVRLLQSRYPQVDGVRLRLKKHIPFGAGLGGGSSDAACVLSLLNRLFHLGLTTLQLQGYAARLGADCAFFIEAVPAYATGIGERLEPCPVDVAGCRIVLLKPDEAVSTAEAYRGITPRNLRPGGLPQVDLRQAVRRPMTEWPQWIVNDFEENVFRLHPRIAQLKDYLYAQGAAYAAMSGSGATVYGLFPSDVSRRVAVPEGVYGFQALL